MSEVAWKACWKCFRIHPTLAPCLSKEEQGEAIMFPCYWAKRSAPNQPGTSLPMVLVPTIVIEVPFLDFGADKKACTVAEEVMLQRIEDTYFRHDATDEAHDHE